MGSRKKPFCEQMQGEESFYFTLPIFLDCRESACGPPALWVGRLSRAAAGPATAIKLQTY